MSLSGKAMFFSGASRGIGRAIATSYTGNSLLCEDVLLESGVTDLSVYDCVPGSELGVDLWVDTPNPPGYTRV
jgi:citronellol/citronellal dehydrogenase